MGDQLIPAWKRRSVLTEQKPDPCIYWLRQANILGFSSFSETLTTRFGDNRCYQNCRRSQKWENSLHFSIQSWTFFKCMFRYGKQFTCKCVVLNSDNLSCEVSLYTFSWTKPRVYTQITVIFIYVLSHYIQNVQSYFYEKYLITKSLKCQEKNWNILFIEF